MFKVEIKPYFDEEWRLFSVESEIDSAWEIARRFDPYYGDDPQVGVRILDEKNEIVYEFEEEEFPPYEKIEDLEPHFKPYEVDEEITSYFELEDEYKKRFCVCPECGFERRQNENGNRN